jgi:hypothetical protein
LLLLVVAVAAGPAEAVGAALAGLSMQRLLCQLLRILFKLVPEVAADLVLVTGQLEHPEVIRCSVQQPQLGAELVGMLPTPLQLENPVVLVGAVPLATLIVRQERQGAVFIQDLRICLNLDRVMMAALGCVKTARRTFKVVEEEEPQASALVLGITILVVAMAGKGLKVLFPDLLYIMRAAAEVAPTK